MMNSGKRRIQKVAELMLSSPVLLRPSISFSSLPPSFFWSRVLKSTWLVWIYSKNYGKLGRLSERRGVAGWNLCAHWRKCFIRCGAGSKSRRPTTDPSFAMPDLGLCPAVRIPVTSSRRWGTEAASVGHLARPLTECIAQLTSEELVFAPAYGSEEDISSNYWAVIEAVKQCSKFVNCIFQIG